MINLDGKRFSPVSNSEAGRVASDAIFSFTQSGTAFRADYKGAGFSDGHLIGTLRADNTALLIYHSRADDGALQAGQAEAKFTNSADGRLTIAMDWQWLNGDQQSGTSVYKEI